MVDPYPKGLEPRVRISETLPRSENTLKTRTKVVFKNVSQDSI